MKHSYKVLSVLLNSDTAKHVSTDLQFYKTQIAKFVIVLDIVLVLYLLKFY